VIQHIRPFASYIKGNIIGIDFMNNSIIKFEPIARQYLIEVVKFSYAEIRQYKKTASLFQKIKKFIHLGR
jgi:hypothetical protein